jgi:hypothetical protein
MSIWDNMPWRSRDPEPPDTGANFYDILRTHDVVDVVNNGEFGPVVVVADRDPGARERRMMAGEWQPGEIQFADPRARTPYGELGTAVPSPFSSWARQEYNSELMGLAGLEKYDRMRRGDGTVRGTLRLVKTPVLSARWFMEPASDSVIDQNKAKFAWCCLTEYMSVSWPQTLTELLLMLDFGYYMFEKVWDIRTIGGADRAVWKKLAPRHPMDVLQWNFDGNGGPSSVEMINPDTLDPTPIIIPIDKLIVFSFDKEGGNIEGLSILRSAYKHWYYKDKLYMIDAIQKERHGIGIPVIKLPMGFSSNDKLQADQLGRNLRTNERAHVVLPPNWELLFAKLEGQPVDAMTSIDHHDKQIQKNVLVAFMDGNAKEEDQTMFLKATRFIADIVADTFNLYAIPQLIDFNFARGDKYPKLRARRIGEQADWRTLSFAIRNLIGAGVIRPDDRLEDSLRKEMDLPPVDTATVRLIQAPRVPTSADPGTTEGNTKTPPAPGGQQQGLGKQNGPNQPGLPRQTPTPPVGPPAKNAGQDRSGG